MITVEEAWERIAAEIDPLPVESVARREATDRILASDLAATVDVPAHDVSAMDGYVLGGTAQAGDGRPVTGVIAAGDAPGFALASGAAARIMTGAPVPGDAWGVVPVEHTDDGDERVTLAETPKPGAHIRRRGEILHRGTPILPAGRRLTPAALSLAATHGYAELPVRRRPRVATLATGNEVVAPDRTPGPGQLRDSHTDFLLAAGRQLGLDFTPLGIATDDVESLRAHLTRGLAYDVLLVSGGVSMGAYDLVEPVFAELGCRPLFDAVALQPGKPLVFARHPSGWVVGLPGNPASVMVGYWLFVQPLLRVLQGFDDGFWRGAHRGRLDAPLRAGGPRDRFLTAEITLDDGEPIVRPAPPKGSHDQTAYARGRALVRIRSGAEAAVAGDPCEFLPLADWP